MDLPAEGKALKGITVKEIFADKFEFTEKSVPAKVAILRQGERCGLIYVLVKGAVTIIKNNQTICTVKEPGAVFGELSVLLGSYQNATVQTCEASEFHVIKGEEQFLSKLETEPRLALHLSKMLARRLALLDSNFSDLKSRIEQMQQSVLNLSEEPGKLG